VHESWLMTTRRRRRGDDDDLIGSVRANTAAGAAVHVVDSWLHYRFVPVTKTNLTRPHTTNRSLRPATRWTIVAGQLFPFVDKILHDRNNSCAPRPPPSTRENSPKVFFRDISIIYSSKHFNKSKRFFRV